MNEIAARREKPDGHRGSRIAEEEGGAISISLNIDSPHLHSVQETGCDTL